MFVLDHIRAEVLVFPTTISENWGVIETTGRGCHEDIRRVIA